MLLAQFSAFPINGADLYEELKTSTAILSTGIGGSVCERGKQMGGGGSLSAQPWLRGFGEHWWEYLGGRLC